MGGENEHRKEWAAELLSELLQCYAIDLQAYALMSNHVHLVLRPRPDVAAAWGQKQLVERGLTQFPIRIGNGMDTLPLTPELITSRSRSADTVAEYKARLCSITWFMRQFKQRLAKRANAEDHCTGHFWESRFLTIPLLDKGAVFSCMAYVDRNPLRAGLSEDLASTCFCSARQRFGKSTGLTKAECALNKHVLPLQDCAPVDPSTGKIRSSQITTSEYRCLVDPTYKGIGSSVFANNGLDQELWREKSQEAGLFQGVAAGSRASREAFAATQGKKIVADKTKIWDNR